MVAQGVLESPRSWKDRATLESDPSAHELRCQGRGIPSALPFSPGNGERAINSFVIITLNALTYAFIAPISLLIA
jgi:hypothetical protein